jgi:glutamine synthetase
VDTVSTILGGWEKDGIEWVRFELPDMHGTSRSKTVPIRHAAGYADRGLNMYGGTSVLDSRSDVVGGTLYHEEDPSLEPLPSSRPEALGELTGEPATKELFGEEFLKVYTAMRAHELARFADWEREEYLELY